MSIFDGSAANVMGLGRPCAAHFEIPAAQAANSTQEFQMESGTSMNN
jgi:hypothetical protein